MNHQHMITPFASSDAMITQHVTMYGPIGQTAAEAVLRYAPLFPELHPLDFLVLFAPIELGPYNRHAGYTVTHRSTKAPRYIVGNRHMCRFDDDGFIVPACDQQDLIDFLVHEITHQRQEIILRRYHIRQPRAKHNDRGWYGAIAEAAPAYLGVTFPPERWPLQNAERSLAAGRLTETEAYHWPNSFRELIAQRDTRLERGTEVDREELIHALSHRAVRRPVDHHPPQR
jgi:hypothetical protein